MSSTWVRNINCCLELASMQSWAEYRDHLYWVHYFIDPGLFLPHPSSYYSSDTSVSQVLESTWEVCSLRYFKNSSFTFYLHCQWSGDQYRVRFSGYCAVHEKSHSEYCPALFSAVRRSAPLRRMLPQNGQHTNRATQACQIFPEVQLTAQCRRTSQF